MGRVIIIAQSVCLFGKVSEVHSLWLSMEDGNGAVNRRDHAAIILA